MRIEKHEVGTALAVPKREQLLDFFVQSLSCIEVAKETLAIIDDARAGDIDEEDELDSLDGQKFNDFRGIQIFAVGGFSAIPSMHVCARDVTHHMEVYNNTLADTVGFGLFLDDEQHDALEKSCKLIISELAYLLFFEFRVEEQLQLAGSDDEFIDEIIKMYCNSYSIDSISILQKIESLHNEFPFHLSIFDDFPEYESDFEAIMGPLMASCIGKDFDIASVKNVINGKVTPEEFIESLSGMDADFDGNMTLF